MTFAELIAKRYDLGSFGDVGELEERSKILIDGSNRLDTFLKNSAAIPWRSIADTIAKEVPNIAFTVFETAYTTLQSHGGLHLWDTSRRVQGHELNRVFDEQATSKVVHLIEEALNPIIQEVKRTQGLGLQPLFNPQHNLKQQPGKLVNGHYLIVSLDVVDGSTNFLNLIQSLLERYTHRPPTLEMFHNNPVDAGLNISFSLEDYPYYDFAAVCYSYATHKRVVFHRDRYGDIGIASRGKDDLEKMLPPSAIRGAGVPKMVVPFYLGERYELHGVFIDALKVYYKSFGKRIAPDGGSRSSFRDLESLLDNQAVAYIDMRNILPNVDPNNVATLKLEDMRAMGSAAMAAHWIGLHTDGRKMQELRKDELLINSEGPIDFMLLNPHFIAQELTEPNLLDAVQYARLKTLQGFYKAIDPQILIDTEKVDQMRMFCSITYQEGQREHPTLEEECTTVLQAAMTLAVSGKYPEAEQVLKNFPTGKVFTEYRANALVLALLNSHAKTMDACEEKGPGQERIVKEMEALCSELEKKIDSRRLQPGESEEDALRDVLRERIIAGVLYYNLSVFYRNRYLQEEKDTKGNVIDRHQAISYSQRAVDYDPLNFHYLKLHGQNFALNESRLHSARVFLEEAIEIGKKMGGYDPIVYMEKLLEVLEKIQNASGDHTLVAEKMRIYGSRKRESIEPLVNQLKVNIAQHARTYGRLWDIMREEGLTEMAHVRDALRIVQYGKATNSEQIVELLTNGNIRDDIVLLELIERGKTRNVYRAREFKVDKEHGDRDYAVSIYDEREPAECKKRLIKSLGTATTVDDLVMQEFTTMMGLTHDNLTQLRYVGELTVGTGRRKEKRFYLAYDFVDGLNLEKYIAQHQPTVRELLSFFHDVAVGLNYYHMHGYIHRDVKLDNIMVTTDENGNQMVKIVDNQFVVKADDEGRAVNDAIASKRYLAPELLIPLTMRESLENEGRKAPAGPFATYKSDVFALGAAMYFAFSEKKVQQNVIFSIGSNPDEYSQMEHKKQLESSLAVFYSGKGNDEDKNLMQDIAKLLVDMLAYPEEQRMSMDRVERRLNEMLQEYETASLPSRGVPRQGQPVSPGSSAGP